MDWRMLLFSPPSISRPSKSFPRGILASLLARTKMTYLRRSIEVRISLRGVLPSLRSSVNFSKRKVSASAVMSSPFCPGCLVANFRRFPMLSAISLSSRPPSLITSVREVSVGTVATDPSRKAFSPSRFSESRGEGVAITSALSELGLLFSIVLASKFWMISTKLLPLSWELFFPSITRFM